MRDRPLVSGVQALVANRLERPWSRARVVSVKEKARQTCQVGVGKTSASEPLMKRRNCKLMRSKHRKAPTFKQGGLSERLPEPIPHQMGLQVSRCVHPEVPTKTYLRKAEGSPRGDTVSWRSKPESLRDTSGRITFTCASIAKILGVDRGLYQRRAPSQSGVGGGTSPGKVFGRGGTSFLRSVSTRLWSVIRNQEKEDRRLEQLNLDWSSKEPD